MFRSYLNDLHSEKKLIDIGCSAGAIGLQLVLSGHKKITFLDHDPEYTDLVSKVLEFIGRDNENDVITSALSDYTGRHDVGIALALIHWLYSYTERYGSLSDVIAKLKQHAGSMLIVEWISENDPAIKSARHIYQNSETHKAPYNYVSFQNALKEHYRYTHLIGSVSQTREIWIASVNPIQKNKKIAQIDDRRIKVIRLKLRVLNLVRRVCRLMRSPISSLSNKKL